MKEIIGLFRKIKFSSTFFLLFSVNHDHRRERFLQRCGPVEQSALCVESIKGNGDIRNGLIQLVKWEIFHGHIIKVVPNIIHYPLILPTLCTHYDNYLHHSHIHNNGPFMQNIG